MIALERLKQEGILWTSTESVLFQFLGSSEHESFKEIQGFVKQSAPDAGLYNIQKRK